MKKLLCALLAVMLVVLCGCGGSNTDPQPTTQATQSTQAPTSATEPAQTPTTEPAMVYTNPLNGETLDAPFTNRIFAVSINNLEAALPHVGVVDADIYMEMFVNGSVIRSLALYSDIASVDSIGSVRSTRIIFNDLADRFSAFLAHAGGSTPVLVDVNARGLSNKNIDTNDSTSYSFRNMDRKDAGYGWEHCLFIKGKGLWEYAKENNYTMTVDSNRTYGMTFTEDATPADGETANKIDITFTLNSGGSKTSTMEYDTEKGGYRYYQYDQLMVDGNTGELEIYENVLMLLVKTHMTEGGYHVAEFTNSGSGEGYFACGGKIIPIQWHCAGDEYPLTFTTADGQPLDLGVGRTYIGIGGLKSTLVYE